jgi:microsomal epoxide hydrolase
LPLLLSHGWPGSVFEFLELLPILTDPGRFRADPADAFTVVAPSLPGYGLSFKPGQPRFGIEEIADCFAELMTEVLGYGRFGAQGGDWGSFITARLGLAYPDRLSGIHLNMLPVRRDPKMVSNPTRDESRYLEELQLWLKEETGYQWIQGTRPQTLAFALTDSPVGLEDRGEVSGLVRLRRRHRVGVQPRPPAGKYQPVLVHGSHRFFLLALLRANAWAVAHPSR